MTGKRVGKWSGRQGREGFGFRAKVLAGALVVWVAAGQALAGEGGDPVAPGEADPGPLVADPVTFDFGVADWSRQVEAAFMLRNVTDRPVGITRVKTSCGCSTATLTRRQVEPGGQVQLTLVLRTRGQRGHVRKTAQVHTDHAGSGPLELALVGRVEAPVSYEPRVVHFDRVREADVGVTAKRVTVELVPGVAARLARLDVEGDWLAAQLEADGPRTWRLVVRIVSVPEQPGLLTGAVTLYFDGADLPPVRVPCLARRIGPLTVTPTDIVLSAEGERPATRFVVIGAGTVETFAVRRVEVPDPGWQVRVQALGKRGCRVMLSGLRWRPELAGRSVVIHTDAEAMPRIELPIVAR